MVLLRQRSTDTFINTDKCDNFKKEVIYNENMRDRSGRNPRRIQL